MHTQRGARHLRRNSHGIDRRLDFSHLVRYYRTVRQRRNVNHASGARGHTGGAAAVNIQPLNGRCPSGATLDGFTLTGGVWGAYAGWANQPGCPANVISNVTLRNLIINTSYYGPPGGHGIDFIGVHNSVIDSCTVNSAGANGIFLESDNQNNLVMNNTIQSTVTQHAIAIQGGTNNVIVGNTINGSAFDGILLNSSSGPNLSAPGSSNNRIERNIISGHRTDGIAM